MGKKRSTGPRAILNNANQRLLVPRRLVVITPRGPFLSKTLTMIEDRRLWHPFVRALRPVVMLNNQRPRLKPVAFSSSKLKNVIPTKVGFDVPKKVAICIRRKKRKEVLFAKNKAGRGTARPKRNQWSDVKC